MTRKQLRKTCGHFRTSPCTVTSDAGTQVVHYCNDCGVAVRFDPPRNPNGGVPLPRTA
jgi:transcription elongation factor Elf1